MTNSFGSGFDGRSPFASAGDPMKGLTGMMGGQGQQGGWNGGQPQGQAPAPRPQPQWQGGGAFSGGQMPWQNGGAWQGGGAQGAPWQNGGAEAALRGLGSLFGGAQQMPAAIPRPWGPATMPAQAQSPWQGGGFGGPRPWGGGGFGGAAMPGMPPTWPMGGRF